MIEYELVRSKRKTLAVQVTREGRVIVRAPLRLAKYRIERFVAEHTDWIVRALADQQSRRAAHPEPDEAKQAELIRRAKIELPPKVQHYAKLMNLYPTGLKITSARTRFGSCSGKNSICFSWRLMDYPEPAIDYVVVHELAHIAHKNHGPQFWALLDAQSRITPENARAVRMAQQAGVQIVLCTGRNVREVRRFSEQLEAAPDWLVTANGATVQHPDDREPAFFDGLSTEMVDIILDECAAIDTDPCLYTTQDLYYGHAFRHFLENLQRRGRVVMDEADEGYHFVEDGNAWREVIARESRPFTKAILYHDDPNAIAPLTAALDKYGIFELAPSVMYGGELRNVEVNRVGVHKGRGLEWLAHHLGCTLANVIAIGDSENDLTMLQMAGLGVAMANSEPCIREAADVITGSNAENGVAQAIYRHILGE